MNLETIQVLNKGKFSTIMIIRQDMLNAVNEQLVWDLQKATENVMNDDSVKVVILTGAGRGFSAGADLRKGKLVGLDQKMLLIRGISLHLKIS